MDAILDLKRFGNYQLRNLFLDRKTYAGLALIFCGIYVILQILNYMIGFNLISFLNAAIYVIIILSPVIYEKRVTKLNSVLEFTLPVSTTEHFLNYVLKYMVFIPVAILVPLLILNGIASIVPAESVNSFGYNLFSDGGSLAPFGKIYFELIQWQSVFLLGYLWFKNNSFIRTLLTLLIVFIFLSILAGVLFKTMLFNDVINMGNINLTLNSPDFVSHLKENSVIEAVTYLFKIIFPFGLWLVGFLKLKEKEI